MIIEFPLPLEGGSDSHISRVGADRVKPLSRLREREGPAAARPWEDEGRRRYPAFPHPSHPFGMGPFPLPQAGEGPIAFGAAAKMCEYDSPQAGEGLNVIDAYVKR